jgi:small subunit ribosomal protein S19
MSRSVWKGNFISKNVLKKKNKNFFKCWSRNSCIPSYLIGKTILVHTGNNFLKVLITRDKVGYKFGEFALTRKFYKKRLENKKKGLK